MGTPLVDGFNRPDDATGLGVAELGGTWDQILIAGSLEGNLGIIDQEAYVAVTGAGLGSLALLDVDSADHSVSVTIDLAAHVAATSQGAGIALGASVDESVPSGQIIAAGVIRFTDASVKAGILTASDATPAVIRDFADITLDSDTVTVTATLIDGEVTATFVSGATTIEVGPVDLGFSGGTLVGIGAITSPAPFTSSLIRFDDFSATPLTVDVDGPCEAFCARSDVEDCGAAPAMVAAAIASATRAMWLAMGRRHGECRGWLRPCPQRCGSCLTAARGCECETARILAAEGVLCGHGWCSKCPPGSRVDLGVPIRAVHEVLIDGAVLDPSTYRCDGTDLVRIDGGSWPTNQVWSSDETEGFAVDVTWGQPVSDLVRIGCAALATEVLKSWLPGEKSRLPARSRTVTQQSTSIQVIDLADLLAQRLTGVTLADLAIAQENPHGAAESETLPPYHTRGSVSL